MALTLLKQVAVSTGVGVLDIVTETVDAQQGLVKPFENISDWVRTGLTVGGYAAAYLKKDSMMGDWLGTAAVAAEPLFLRTVYQAATKINLFGMAPAGSIRLVRSGQGAYGGVITPPIAPPAGVPTVRAYRSFAPG